MSAVQRDAVRSVNVDGNSRYQIGALTVTCASYRAGASGKEIDRSRRLVVVDRTDEPMPQECPGDHTGRAGNVVDQRGGQIMPDVKVRISSQ